MQNLYADAGVPPVFEYHDDSTESSGERVTVSVKEMPVTEFLRVIAAQYNQSVVWSDGLDKRLVSVECVDVPIEDVFEGLSRRFGVTTQHVGKSWYVGEFRNEDRATLVRKTLRLSPEDVSAAVAVVLGADSRSKSFKDGLLVVSDRAESLRRLSLALDEIENARSDSWVVQLYLFSCSRDASKSLGLDTSALVDLSYTFAKSSLAPSPANGVHLASTFSAVMAATASREDVRLVGRPLFVLSDGEKSSFVSGVSVPVPKKTVSDQGTVTTSGFDYVQSGLTSDVSIREGARGTGYLTVHVSLGQITGYVETAPVQSKNEFQTSAVVSSNGVYLLGALDQDTASDGTSGLHAAVPLKKTTGENSVQIQVWARMYRVAGPISHPKFGGVDLRGSSRSPALPMKMSAGVHLAPAAVGMPAEIITLESGSSK